MLLNCKVLLCRQQKQSTMGVAVSSLRLHTDSSAATGMLRREGVGTRVRHIETAVQRKFLEPGGVNASTMLRIPPGVNKQMLQLLIASLCVEQGAAARMGISFHRISVESLGGLFTFTVLTVFVVLALCGGQGNWMKSEVNETAVKGEVNDIAVKSEVSEIEVAVKIEVNEIAVRSEVSEIAIKSEVNEIALKSEVSAIGVQTDIIETEVKGYTFARSLLKGLGRVGGFTTTV
eukprot:296768-Amphidinium_carterae.2